MCHNTIKRLLIIIEKNKHYLTKILYMSFCFVAFCLGIYLRYSDIDKLPLRFNEIHTAAFTSFEIQEIIPTIKKYDVHPPLYYLQLRLWRLFGHTDRWLRLNSVVWGMIGVLLIWFVAKGLFQDNMTALGAVVLFSVNPSAVLQAMHARMYTMLMVLSLVSFYAMHKSLVAKNWKSSVVFSFLMSIATTVMSWSHGAGVVIFLSIGLYIIYYAFFNRITVLRLFSIYFFLGISFLTTIPLLKRGQEKIIVHGLVPQISDILEAFAGMLVGTQQDYFHLLLWVISVVSVCFILIAVYYKNRESLAIIFAFIVSPMALFIIMSYVIKPMWISYSLSWMIPFLCLAISSILFPPIPMGSKKISTKYMRIVGFCVLLLVCTFQAYFAQKQKTNMANLDFPSAIHFVKEKSHPTDIIIPVSSLFWGWFRYWVGPEHQVPIALGQYKKSGEPLIIAQISENKITPNRNYWVVFRTACRQSDLNDILKLMDKNKIRIQEEYAFDRLSVIMLSK